MKDQSGIPGIKAEHYESKRKDYMVPEWNEDSVIDQFEITIQSHDPIELRRQVCASMTAFFQADDAYMETKKIVASQAQQISELTRKGEELCSAYGNSLIMIHDLRKALEAIVKRVALVSPYYEQARAALTNSEPIAREAQPREGANDEQ